MHPGKHQPSNSRSFKETVQDFWLQGAVAPVRYGMGCAWLGTGDHYTSNLESDLFALATAYRMGVRYFDTAVAYAHSEWVLGEFVVTVPRQSIFLATKFNLPPGNNPGKAAEHAQGSLEESLRRLKTDYLDLFQVHDFENLDCVLAEGGVLDTLLEARRQGMTRYIGVATRQHWLLKGAMIHGGFDTILTYGDFTPQNQSAADLIRLANQSQVGVINASPLLGAREAGLHLNQPSVLREMLVFPLANPGIDINLTGPANAVEVGKNFGVLKMSG